MSKKIHVDPERWAKTENLQALGEVLSHDRDEAWRESFLELFPYAVYSSPQPSGMVLGDFIFFKLFSSLKDGDNLDPESTFGASFVIDYCLKSGCGLVVNPQDEGGCDWIFSYGDLWHFYIMGKFSDFLTISPNPERYMLERLGHLWPQKGKLEEIVYPNIDSGLLPDFAMEVMRKVFRDEEGFKSDLFPSLLVEVDPLYDGLVRYIFDLQAGDLGGEAELESFLQKLNFYLPTQGWASIIGHDGIEENPQMPRDNFFKL